MRPSANEPRCTYHSNLSAQDYCQKCGNGICGGCVRQRPSGDVYCFRCVAGQQPVGASGTGNAPATKSPVDGRLIGSAQGTAVGAFLLTLFGPCLCTLPGLVGLFMAMSLLGKMERREVTDQGHALAVAAAILGFLNAAALVGVGLYLLIEGPPRLF